MEYGRWNHLRPSISSKESAPLQRYINRSHLVEFSSSIQLTFISLTLPLPTNNKEQRCLNRTVPDNSLRGSRVSPLSSLSPHPSSTIPSPHSTLTSSSTAPTITDGLTLLYHDGTSTDRLIEFAKVEDDNLYPVDDNNEVLERYTPEACTLMSPLTIHFHVQFDYTTINAYVPILVFIYQSNHIPVQSFHSGDATGM